MGNILFELRGTKFHPNVTGAVEKRLIQRGLVRSLGQLMNYARALVALLPPPRKCSIQHLEIGHEAPVFTSKFTVIIQLLDVT